MLELATFLWFSTMTAFNAIESTEPIKTHLITCQQNHAIKELTITVPISASQEQIDWKARNICEELYGEQSLTIEAPKP